MHYLEENVRLLRSRWYMLGLAMLLALTLGRPVLAQGLTLAEQIRLLAHAAQEGVEAAEANEVALMQAEFEEIELTWESIEDEVQAQDPTAYVELEGALHNLAAALQAEPLEPNAVRFAYDHLLDEANEIATRFEGGAPAAPAVERATPGELLKNLDAAYLAIERGDAAEARSYLAEVMRTWPAVEGVVAARSQEAYTAIEVGLGRAAAALETEPADLAGAEVAVEQLRQSLAPFITRQSYTMFDAAAIILREGLEALLIVAALLAFLRHSGNADKRRWIWLGGFLGVLASVITAFALQAIFSQAAAGQNRELIEGITGLLAAGLLFYVSYWLHSKASLHAWQAYIQTNTSRLIKRGSLAGLALLAFLAVFREGAETAVFYLGMAPAIALSDLLLGLGIGLAGLVVVAVLILVAGVKLPIRLFFRVAGLLVYYLGFKFVGNGIHALQVAGILPASLIGPLPAVPLVGLYPTWESLAPQLLLLAAALVTFFYLRSQDRRQRQGAPSAAAT